MSVGKNTNIAFFEGAEGEGEKEGYCMQGEGFYEVVCFSELRDVLGSNNSRIYICVI